MQGLRLPVTRRRSPLPCAQGEVDVAAWHKGLAQLREAGSLPFAFPHGQLHVRSPSSCPGMLGV